MYIKIYVPDEDIVTSSRELASELIRKVHCTINTNAVTGGVECVISHMSEAEIAFKAIRKHVQEGM